MKIRDILRLAAAKPLVSVTTTPGEVYAEGGERYSFKRLHILGNKIVEKSWATDGATVWSLAIGRGRTALFRSASDRVSVSVLPRGARHHGKTVMILDANAPDAVIHDSPILSIGDLRLCVENGSISNAAHPYARPRPAAAAN